MPTRGRLDHGADLGATPALEGLVLSHVRYVAAAMSVSCLSLAWAVALPGAQAQEHIFDVPTTQVDGGSATAADFVDSMGVNVHMPYLDRPYADRVAVADALEELGVMHVRDEMRASTPYLFPVWRDLGDRGIGVTFVVEPDRNGSGSLESQVNSLASELAGVTEALEGANEYDLSGLPDWPSAVAAHQQRLDELVSAEPRLQHVAVYGPSFTSPAAVDRADAMHGAIDAVNVHPYAAGGLPSTNLDLMLAPWRTRYPGTPAVATEAGYHNALTDKSGQPAVSEETAAAYILRTYLDFYASGVRRTFIYELVDEAPHASGMGAEGAFGLVNSDFSRKLAFEAVRNLVDVLDDEEPVHAAPATSVQVRAQGMTETESKKLRVLRLNRSDGSLDVVVWTDTRMPNERDAPVGTVTLTSETPVTRTLYRPMVSSEGQTDLSALTAIDIQVGPAPVVVRLARVADSGRCTP